MFNYVSIDFMLKNFFCYIFCGGGKVNFVSFVFFDVILGVRRVVLCIFYFLLKDENMCYFFYKNYNIIKDY